MTCIACPHIQFWGIILKLQKHYPIHIECYSSDSGNIFCNSLNIIDVHVIYLLFSNGPRPPSPPQFSTVSGFFLLTVLEIWPLFLEICNPVCLISVLITKKATGKKKSANKLFCSFILQTEKSSKWLKVNLVLQKSNPIH